MKGTQIAKKQNYYVCIRHDYLCRKSQINYGKFLELISEYNNVTRYKINKQKSIALTCIQLAYKNKNLKYYTIYNFQKQFNSFKQCKTCKEYTC